jgi:hypothetical protein
MTSYQVAEWLRKGIAAAQAGNAETAYELLVKVVDVDEYNEQAWLWLSSVVETDADREVCLENVLAINPDNKVAKAGLVHLHSKSAQPPPPLELEPEPTQPEIEISPLPKGQDTEVASVDWWDQPQSVEQAADQDGFWEETTLTASASAADIAEPEIEGAEGLDVAPPVPRRRPRIAQTSSRPVAVAVLLILGLLAASVAVFAALRIGVFDPSKQEYAQAMHPLMAQYDDWWAGPQGALVEKLNNFCGPTADGWRNRDVLTTCNSIRDVECAQLTAHCDTDVEAMRERVEALAQEARRAGQSLLSEFAQVSPPDEIASSHHRFLACLRARIADADRTAKLARGEPVSNPDDRPICQMFASADAELRTYIGRPPEPSDGPIDEE